MERNKRIRRLIGSPAQKKLLILIFACAVIPTAIVALCLYYLIFNLLAVQIGIPEAIAYNLIPVARKVNLIILIVLPITLFVIWWIALVVSNRMVGSLSRLERELDSRISHKKTTPIYIRKKDILKPLVDKINQLLK